jgi:hypothetical protein
LGIPAVCPQVVAGTGFGRFGYDPKRPETIMRAIENALENGAFVPQPQLDWKQVTERIVEDDGMRLAGGQKAALNGAPEIGGLIRFERGSAQNACATTKQHNKPS